MKTKLALLVALALSTSATAAFRCVDEKGRTHGMRPLAAAERSPLTFRVTILIDI